MNGISNLRILSAVLIIILFIGSIVFIAINVQSTPEMSHHFKYDDDGRLVSHVDAEGNRIGFTYDDKGRIIETRYPDKHIHNKYDAQGNLVSVKDDEGGGVDFQYDAFGRLTMAKYQHSPERTVNFDYDPFGNVERIKIQDSNGQIVHSVGYEYDMLSQLKSVEIPEGKITYSYFPAENKVVRQFPNGVTSTFTFSSQVLPISIHHEGTTGNLLAEYKYEYDSAGRVTRAIENFPDIGIQENRYEWDSRGYLIGWTKPDSTKISFTYDSIGNRLSKTDLTGTLHYQYDNFGRLTQAGNLKYKWDKTGKLTTQMEGDKITKIGYNGIGLPSTIKTPDTTVRYDWDTAGNMISKQQGNKITYTLPNPLSLPGSTLAEFDKRGELTSSYVYGDGLLAQHKADGMRFFLEDGFKSIRHVADMNGRILGQQDYTPFGEPYAVKGDNIGDFYSSGVRYLPEIKSYDIGGRSYNPSIVSYHDPNPLTGLGTTLGGTALSGFANAKWGAGWGESTGFLFAFADPLSKQVGRIYFSGGPLWTSEDIGGYTVAVGKYGLSQMGFALGGLPGQYGAILVGEATENLARFYGTRMDRPYWWWQREKWMPLDEYLQHEYPHLSKQQDRQQASLMANIDPVWEYKDDEIKPPYPFVDRGEYYPDHYEIPPGPFDKGNGGAGINPLLQTPLDNDLGGIELAAKAEFLGDLGRVTAVVYDPDTGRVVLVGDGDTTLPSLSQEDMRIALKLALVGADAEFSLDPVDPKNPEGKWLKAVYYPDDFPPLFSWDDVPGSDSKKLLEFLEKDIGEKWVKDAEIKKSDDDKTIIVKKRGKSLTINFNEEKNILVIEIEGDKKRKVIHYHLNKYDILKGTKFGYDLFDADWLLKQYSFGVEVSENGGTSERTTQIESFKDMFDLGFENFDAQKGKTWNRFWIINEEATLRKTDNTIYFDTIKMGVKTEEGHIAGKELTFGSGKEDPDAREFADFFTAHYDEFAEESPSFARVKEMAKAVALAKWLVDDLGVPIDTIWLDESTVQDEEFEEYMQALSRRPNFKIAETEEGMKFVDQVHTLDEEQKRGTVTQWMFGGVKLEVKPEYIADDGSAQRIKEKVGEAIKDNPDQAMLDIQDGERTLKAVMLPITDSGISLWGDLTGGIVNAEYTRTDEGKLQSFKFETIDGWTATADRTTDDSSELIVTSPTDHSFHYLYDSEGSLSQLNVDGERFADYHYDSQTRTNTINYDNWKEQITYNEDGRVHSYTRVRLGEEHDHPDTLQFDYDQEGRLIKMDGRELGSTKFEYKGDLLTSTQTPWGKFTYSYDSDNRIQEISEPEATITFHYDGKSLNRAVVDYQEQKAEIIFANELLHETHGFGGETIKYDYTAERLLGSVTDPVGAKTVYQYDDKLRLQRIDTPDGSAIAFVYGIVGKGENTQERLVKTIVYPIRE